MAQTRRGALAALSAAIFASGTPAQPREPRRVLMLGNSFTYGAGLPGMVRALAPGLHFEVIARSGSQLKLFARNDVIRKTVRNTPHDLLVLQDHSIEPLTTAGQRKSEAAMKILSELSGARLVLFATWPRRTGHSLYGRVDMPAGPAEMNAVVSQHYRKQARRLGASLAPVGDAWRSAIEAGHDLYATDGYHANASGAFLTALVLTRAMGAEPTDWQPGGISDAASLRSVAVRTT